MKAAALGACALWTVALAAGPVASQDVCSEPVPRFGDGLVFFDQVGSLFNRSEALFATHLTNGTAQMDTAMTLRFRARTASIRSALQQIEEKNAAPRALEQLYADLGAYQDFLRAGFGQNPVPPEIERLLCPLRTSYLRWTMDALREHERKLVIRHGPRSERLNVVEMLLNEWMSRKSGMGELRDPPKLEWILRAQVVGFQYDESSGHVRPGSPTYQLGASYYLFGTGKIATWVHHVGIAAAYQRNLVTNQDMYGGVLHLQQYDLGFLCPRRSCRGNWTVVGSKNVSLLPGTWAKLRQQLTKD